jgi:hypothetical protein
MALAFLHKPANRRTFSGKAAIWVTTDNGATHTRLSDSAELAITPEATESEVVNNRGHGRMDDVLKNMIVEGKFVERGEDVRQIYTDDTDQSMRGKYYGLWIQGADLVNASGTAVYEQWVFPRARLMRGFPAYGLGTGEPMIGFKFYCEANDTCATVTITAPSGDPCFMGAASTTQAVADGEIFATFDVAAS